MKYLFISINLFICIFQITKATKTYVIYPFKKSTKEPKIYPENLLQNDLEITLKIGTPPQTINLNLRSKAYTFFVSGNEVNLSYPTFNELNSSTLIKEEDKPTKFGGQEYNQGYKIFESIIINKKEIKNISLILATSLEYKESGALGLRLVDSHETGDDLSFIYQIKNKAKLDNYAFSLRYDNDEKGELIIGSYPHLFDKKFNEDNFYYTKVGFIGNNANWVLDFDIIRYDNKTITSIITKSLIQIEFGLIVAPFKLKKFFNENYFENKCKEEFYLKRNITIFHCDKSFNITEFKNMSFILKDINYEFVLTYQDLFIEEKDEYIFSIVFDENVDNKNPTWILGKPFMKKYQLIYDLDRKIIGLYKDEHSNNTNKMKIFYILILIFLILIIIGLIIYIIFFITKRRRKKAYELDDDGIDYIVSE